jgi:hypothetical protein
MSPTPLLFAEALLSFSNPNCRIASHIHPLIAVHPQQGLVAVEMASQRCGVIQAAVAVACFVSAAALPLADNQRCRREAARQLGRLAEPDAAQ